MSSLFSTLWARLMGGRNGDKSADEGAGSAQAAEAVEYKGYRIIPSPYRNKGQFQTAGLIEKDFPSGRREHRFVRAETHPTLTDAVSFATAKGKQIIDEQGDRLFG